MRRDYRQPSFEILKDRQVRIVMRLLSQTAHPINGITSRVGYVDPAAFIPAFCRQTGLCRGRRRRGQ